jgi:2-methylcitrate dehydratase PrpD
VSAHLLDRDDVDWASLTHPGGVVWPAVLTLGGEGGASPDELERAACAGYEATVRLALALGPEHRRYWHATATAGSVGAAIGGALALGLDEQRAATAVGHASSVAGGSIVCMLERSGTRFFHRAHAAATGVAAARSAGAGLAATQNGLDGERGLFAAMGGSAGGLGEPRSRAAIEEVAFRLHAATGFAQAAIEAAAELAPIAASARVVLELPPAAAAMSGSTRPETREDAWWSAPYAVAVTLLGLELEDRSHVDDPAVRELLRRMDVRPGAGSRVTVDGRSAERAEAHAATDDDLVAKWRLLNPGAAPPLELLF